MNKYENGKIYKLFCNESNLVYYGSTITNLNHRLSQHKTNKKGTSISRIMINPQIELIENFPCNSKKELEQRERYFIENNECINIKIPGRTKQEYRENNKEIFKQKQNEYYKLNKEKLNEKSKKYRENNKDKMKELHQKWYKLNKEKYNEYTKKKYIENMKDETFRIQKNDKAKIWREENPDYFKEKIECECGIIITKQNLKRHKKSKKHQDFECKKSQISK
tara:strand:- start:101 stop:766 length:666 start_codon:yes stop_codon:yes gene_type:complete